jgi:hypothetical protein
LATSLFLTSSTAEARFGKRSDSSSSGKVHEASPVGSSSGDENDGSGANSSSGSSAVSTILDILIFVADAAARSPRYEASHYETTGGDTSIPADTSSAAGVTESHPTPMHPYHQEPPVVEEQRREPVMRGRNRVLFRMGLEGQALGEGSSVGLNLGLEGQRWGADAAATSLKLRTDDGAVGEDKLGLYSAHVTYALYTSDRGRLRAEGGLALAKAPDISFIGPSIALSFERCLFGALDVEGRGQLVPVPHLQAEAQAGLALHLGILTLRSGWRWLLLDDRGLVDDVVHRDYVSGPYAGLGLNF